MKYSIDTSALIHAWRVAYAPTNFPGVWAKIGELIATGHLCAIDEVLLELKERDDELLKWAKDNRPMFRAINFDIEEKHREILRLWPASIVASQSGPFADPFVIALAATERCIVVTEEKKTGNMKGPKIPDVCDHLGVQWTTCLGLIQREGWRFD